MINTRHALLRQAQEYFHTYLLGTVPWDKVIVDKPIPIPSVRGNREQGKFKDLVVAHFDGFRMEILGPFEDDKWPIGRVKVSHGGSYFEGTLDALSWARAAEFIKEQKRTGEHDGRISSGEAWGR